MKTYGFLVAIETDATLDPEELNDLIINAIEYSSNIQQIALEVDCETLGEIDVYSEDGTKQEETN